MSLMQVSTVSELFSWIYCRYIYKHSQNQRSLDLGLTGLHTISLDKIINCKRCIGSAAGRDEAQSHQQYWFAQLQIFWSNFSNV